MTSHSTVDDANGRRCNHEQGEKGHVTLSGRGQIARIAEVPSAGVVEGREFAGRVLPNEGAHTITVDRPRKREVRLQTANN